MNVPRSFADLNDILIDENDLVNASYVDDTDQYYEDDDFEDESPIKNELNHVKMVSSLDPLDSVPYVDDNNEFEQNAHHSETDQNIDDLSISDDNSLFPQLDSSEKDKNTQNIVDNSKFLAIVTHEHLEPKVFPSITVKETILSPNNENETKATPKLKTVNLCNSVPIQNRSRNFMFSKVTFSNNISPKSAPTVQAADVNSNAAIESAVRKVLTEMRAKDADEKARNKEMQKLLSKKSIPIANLQTGMRKNPLNQNYVSSPNNTESDIDIDDAIPFYDPDYIHASSLSKKLPAHYLREAVDNHHNQISTEPSRLINHKVIKEPEEVENLDVVKKNSDANAEILPQDTIQPDLTSKYKKAVFSEAGYYSSNNNSVRRNHLKKGLGWSDLKVTELMNTSESIYSSFIKDIIGMH